MNQGPGAHAVTAALLGSRWVPLQAREGPSHTRGVYRSFLLAATSTRSVTSAGSTAARSTCPPPSLKFALSPTDGRR